MSTSRMPKSLPDGAPLLHPCAGQGGAQGQADLPGILDDDSPLAWTMRLHAAVQVQCTEWGGQDALAAESGKSRQNINLRLRRALDTKGDPQRLTLDEVGVLCSGATGRAARWALLTELCKAFGAKPPEPVVQVTDGDRARLLGAALSDKAKRQIEREHGLPAGSLG